MDLQIDYPTVIAKFDTILARGLCSGVGDRDGQMCIEAAICAALDLPHGDDPICVEPAVRSFKIRLNDSPWSSPQARAAGLRDLGIAQIGSKGVVDGREFSTRLAEKTIRMLLPKLYRQLFPGQSVLLAAAQRCETEGTRDAASAAAASAASAAAYAAASAASANAAAYAAYAASAAYAAAAASDSYLLLSASLALEVLRELHSPGCAYV